MTEPYEIIDAYRFKEFNVQTLKFIVPLDYQNEASDKISVVARLVTKFKQIGAPSTDANYSLDISLDDPNICVYLQGGPGFPCPPPPDYLAHSSTMIEKGFQMLYLDQRGTGLSSPIDSQKLLSFANDKERLDYICHFRALDIVQDAEFIRNALIKDKKWSLLGQSYGGFCSTTYLSYYPESLKQVMVTGGIPPINLGPDDVYTSTYQATEARNVAYYRKHPNDIAKVHKICEYLTDNKPRLPNGGTMSIERFQAIGISFGATSGTDKLHNLVVKLYCELEMEGRFTFGSLNEFQNMLSFDTNIIYMLFQEAIYLDSGMSSNWSADRLRYKSKINYDYSSLSRAVSEKKLDKSKMENAVYFTGEMVYKSMLDDFVELAPLKTFANLLHTNKDWGKSPLYKPEVLQENTVPMAAATYYHDQYVTFPLSMRSKEYIKGIKQYITSEYFHNGLGEDTKKILDILTGLLNNGDTI